MAKKSLEKGLFITFEGPEGCGKTTHSKLLYEALKEEGHDCVYTREPGGTKLGEGIRNMLLHSKDIEISAMSELFLFEAARSEIVKEVIAPALAKNKIVICDRFYDATTAYQGYAGGIPVNIIEELNKTASGGLKPDLTILLDIETAAGLERAKGKGSDRMEAKEIFYHQNVRKGYLKIAEKEPARIKVIKVDDEIPAVQSKIKKEVEVAVQGYKRAG